MTRVSVGSWCVVSLLLTCGACGPSIHVRWSPADAGAPWKVAVWRTWLGTTPNRASYAVTELPTDSSLHAIAVRCVTPSLRACTDALPHGWTSFSGVHWVTQDSGTVTMHAFTVMTARPASVGVSTTTWLIVRRNGRWSATDVGGVSIEDLFRRRG